MSNPIEFEHNEQRMKDVEIPLFELEQRVEKLEQSIQNFQIDMVGKLVEAVSQKMNSQMSIYLPKIKNQLDDFRLFKEKTDLKLQAMAHQETQNQPSAVDASEIQSIKFMVNNLKTEVDY